MTAATLTHLPLAAGGAVLNLTGNAIHWGFARFMRAPLANTGIFAMLTLSAMASSNALYMQRHEHPAPLFAPVERTASVAPREILPVIPATRRKPQTIAPLPSQETTGSLPAVDATPKIGNAEVTEIQRKLHSMQLFDGAIDGLYGPRTARAIKAFEERVGLRVRGELTFELLEAVRKAPVILPEPVVEALPKPDPLPAVTKPAPAAVVAPVAEPAPMAATPAPAAEAVTFKPAADKPTAETELAPLPAPAPLQLVGEPAKKPQVMRRELPQTPEAALDLLAQTAEEAIDTIADGVQSIAMTSPPKRRPAALAQPVAAEPPTGSIAAAAPVAAQAAPVQQASVGGPQVGVPLAMPEEPAAKSSDDVAELTTDAKPEELMPPFSVTDPVLVAKVQRGLASLGFLYGPADGVAGEATAKAIRNFEVYYNYKVTGRISPELLDLLVQNGASI